MHKNRDREHYGHQYGNLAQDITLSKLNSFANFLA